MGVSTVSTFLFVLITDLDHLSVGKGKLIHII